MNAVTRTVFPVFAFKVMHGMIVLTWFCKLLTRVAILSGERESSASMARRLWFYHIQLRGLDLLSLEGSHIGFGHSHKNET